jgi:hypothetical protein
MILPNIVLIPYYRVFCPNVNIKSLCLRGIQRVSDEAVERIVNLFPDIRILDLRYI